VLRAGQEDGASVAGRYVAGGSGSAEERRVGESLIAAQCYGRVATRLNTAFKRGESWKNLTLFG
jgi:hypothetical protein